MVSLFEELGLQPQFVQAIDALGFDQPTPIQQAAIPPLLNGRNVLGQAQTGTGKTAAFALPMLQGIQPGQKKPQALVLTPTRELAIQVTEATTQLASSSPLRILAVYGGQSYRIQTRQLDHGVDVVVGTPGRLLDLIRQEALDLSHVRFLAIDEADELLEMGFIEDVEAILQEIPAERQIALFSATLPPAIRKLADRYLTDPERITIDPTRVTVAETEQRYILAPEEKKQTVLTRLLEVEEISSALIFTRTKAGAQELSDELNRRGIPAGALHGDLDQGSREAILNRFRQHSVTLLVATDVAARGLDIENVSHVINFDAPSDAEDYVHRIGRTGRAGRKGVAITFVTPRERRRLKMIEAFTRQRLQEQQAPTRDEVLASRDRRFIERLSTKLTKKTDSSREDAILSHLVANNFSLEDIAMAAMRLARDGESSVPAEEPARMSLEGKAPRFNDEKPQFSKRSSVERDQDSGSEQKKGTRSQTNSPWEHYQEAGMVRLKMNLGNAHGLRPSDVVGAIASEVGIPGRAIGEIAIHRNHTFVDVAEKHVQQVLQVSTGQYKLYGKPVMLKLAN
jgi:ATP-dependent RNA helicase DeaD